MTTSANAPLRMVVGEAAAIRLALSGFGMALLPECLISGHMAEGHLQLAFPDYRLARKPAELAVAFVRRQIVPRRMRGFIDACIVHFGSLGDRRSRTISGGGILNGTVESEVRIQGSIGRVTDELYALSLPAKNGFLAECVKLMQGGNKDG